jgi:hypothetical protein
MLQILDDGRLTDSKGREVNFKNTVIIMTSNVGAQYIFDYQKSMQTPPQEAEMERKVEEELHKHFRPEFLNRIDDVIIFHALDMQHIKRSSRSSPSGWLADRRQPVDGSATTPKATGDHLPRRAALKRAAKLIRPLAMKLPSGSLPGDGVRQRRRGRKIEPSSKGPEPGDGGVIRDVAGVRLLEVRGRLRADLVRLIEPSPFRRAMPLSGGERVRGGAIDGAAARQATGSETTDTAVCGVLGNHPRCSDRHPSVAAELPSREQLHGDPKGRLLRHADE